MIFVILLLFAVPAGSWAQPLSSDDLTAYHAVIQRKTWDTVNVDVHFKAWLDSYDAFLDAVINGTEADLERFEITAENAMLTIPDDQVPQHRFYRNEIGLQSAFVKLKFGQELSALWQMRQVYRVARENILLFPEFIPFKRTWGILQILVGAIPDNYQWVPRIFGFDGSITVGKDLLQQIPDAHWLFSESRVIIYLTNSYLLEDSDDSTTDFKHLIENHQHSPLFSYLYMTLLLRDHKAETVIDHYESTDEHLSLSTYVYANALLQKGSYPEAVRAFREFEATYSGSDFRKDSAFKTYLAFYLNGQDKEARTEFERISRTGAVSTESDKYASKMSNYPDPDKNIMRIRLATDGGYYKEAARIAENLKEGDFTKVEDRTEFIYRKARLYHFTNQIPRAISDYEKTVELQGDHRWYFAPNSCLQLGYIYLELDQKDKARYYFEKTFEYRSYEYKKGIDRKAHSALTTYF